MRNSSSSPLARYFKTVDPQPFYDACIFDTSDCQTNVPASESFCNVTAAYTALLREKGVWAQQLPECGGYRYLTTIFRHLEKKTKYRYQWF
jgi:hypothetical protein